MAGHGIQIVDRTAAVARIETALAARREAEERDGNPILIVGRTDCRAALGLDEAVSRCQIFAERGCDIVYAENLQSPDEYLALRRLIDNEDTPLMLAQVQIEGSHGSTDQHLYSLQDVTDMGYQLALFGITGLQSVVDALQNTAAEMLHHPQPGPNSGLVKKQPLASFDTVKQVINYADFQDFEANYPCE